MFTARQELIIPVNTGCACPGNELPFTCTVVGNGATSWEGTAFDCTAQRIVLRHNLFTGSAGATGMCNNGAIVGRSLEVNNNCYTSQLDVTVDYTFSNETIACVHSGIGTIGTVLLMIPEGILINNYMHKLLLLYSNFQHLITHRLTMFV